MSRCMDRNTLGQPSFASSKLGTAGSIEAFYGLGQCRRSDVATNLMCNKTANAFSLLTSKSTILFRRLLIGIFVHFSAKNTLIQLSIIFYSFRFIRIQSPPLHFLSLSSLWKYIFIFILFQSFQT